MNRTQHLIDNARTWLANPKNANHRNRADIEADLRRLESREHTTASNHAVVGTDADMASQIVSLFAHHTGAAPSHLAAQVRTGAAPDTEAALAAQILTTAGITPRAASASPGHGLTSNATPQTARAVIENMRRLRPGHPPTGHPQHEPDSASH